MNHHAIQHQDKAQFQTRVIPSAYYLRELILLIDGLMISVWKDPGDLNLGKR